VVSAEHVTDAVRADDPMLAGHEQQVIAYIRAAARKSRSTVLASHAIAITAAVDAGLDTRELFEYAYGAIGGQIGMWERMLPKNPDERNVIVALRAAVTMYGDQATKDALQEMINDRAYTVFVIPGTKRHLPIDCFLV
jgi:hypothetical protein